MANQPPQRECGCHETDQPARSKRQVGGHTKVHDESCHGLEQRELERHLPWAAQHRELGVEQIDPLLVIDEGWIRRLGLPKRRDRSQRLAQMRQTHEESKSQECQHDSRLSETRGGPEAPTPSDQSLHGADCMGSRLFLTGTETRALRSAPV